MSKIWKLIFAQATAISTLAFFLWAEPAYSLADEPFIVKPYVQMGTQSKDSAHPTEEVLWMCDSAFKDWTIEYKNESDKAWKTVAPGGLQHHAILDAGRDNLEQYICVLHNLVPGGKFNYQVKLKGTLQLASDAVAPKQPNQPCKIAVFGDCGYGSPGQKEIANQCYKAHPDLVVIPGDVVYMMGLFSEYQLRFFPVYNADKPSESGVPLLRSTMIMPVVGNHDIAYVPGTESTNMNRFPEGLAFYTIFDLPQNGPATKYGEENTLQLSGDKEIIDRFLKSAGTRFPRQSTYSFEYGDTHWTVLDANDFMDYRNEKTRAWIKQDLTSAKTKWKFVTYHQPGFSCDATHFSEQQMRLLADLFEECGVDVVFCGHAHNYQCTYPIHFQAQKRDGQYVVLSDGRVPGKFTLDKHFDGKTATKPDGIIYIVTGGGGGLLYGQRMQQPDEPDFVKLTVSKTHSFTLCDIEGDSMTIRQIAANGELLDEFKVTKH